MNDLAKPAGPAAVVQGSILAVLPSCTVVPALVARLGDGASWRYIEFFTAHIRNPNTGVSKTWGAMPQAGSHGGQTARPALRL